MGDFNCRHRTLGDSISTSKANHLLHMCTQHSLHILNTRDTPNAPTYQNSILDLALSNKPHLFRLSLNTIDIASDHSPLTCTWLPSLTPSAPQPLKPTWNIPLADWDRFKSDCAASFSILLPTIRNLANNATQQSIDRMSNLITHNLNKAAENAIPKKAASHIMPGHEALWELNRKYCNLHNKHKRIKNRIKRREASGLTAPDLTAALAKVQQALASAKAAWEYTYKTENNNEWQKLTNKIQATNNKDIAWKIWRRTIPSLSPPQQHHHSQGRPSPHLHGRIPKQHR